MTELIKPKGASWRDWWASRTNKWVSVILAVYLAVQNGGVSLTDLGISEGIENFFMSVVGIGIAVGLFKLRASTSQPLEGRSEQ